MACRKLKFFILISYLYILRLNCFLCNLDVLWVQVSFRLVIVLSIARKTRSIVSLGDLSVLKKFSNAQTML